MTAVLRFFIIAASIIGLAVSAFGQQFLVIAVPRNNAVSWPHHPNRLGVEAYQQGGAFVANIGSVTAMLFNPAGLAQMPGRLMATVETGWASETDYIRFFNIDIASGFQPVQFAGIALQPWRKLSIGAFYARPTDYNLDLGRLEVTDENNPDGTGEFFQPRFERKQISLGLSLATSFGEQLSLGGSVEWRRSSFRDEINQMITAGDAETTRFTVGAILRIKAWRAGISAQTKHNASGDATVKNNPLLVNIDPDPSAGGRINILLPSAFRFSHEEPATIRFGLATPHAFGRLRLNADVEYTDFNEDVPIARWQFYGGGTFQLAPNLHLGFGAFTFAKDYSAYIQGPESEIFWTAGGALELAKFRFSVSFMDGDLLTQNFSGQRFLNFAIGYAIQ